jgi:hypothetical protein
MVTITTTRMTPTQILPEGVELGISKLVCEVIRAKQNNFCYYSPPPRGGGGGAHFEKIFVKNCVKWQEILVETKCCKNFNPHHPQEKNIKNCPPPYSLLSFIFEKIKVSKFV